MDQSEDRAKILIVDDNKQNIEMLMELFRGEYRIAAALNAKRAIKVARSDAPPDIILLDIIMPEVNGYQLCAELKEDPRTKYIPIIFVTAVSEIMDENRGFALGAVDYITKPFHPPMVEARVKLHLNLKRKQELLEKYAFIDALTEIPNRRRFDQTLEDEWHRAMRSETPLSLIMLDIDHFKHFNDTYGHGKGDECLRRVARAMERSLRRSSDFVARYGGEEFAVILPSASVDEASNVADQIRVAVNNLQIEHSGSPVTSQVTLSMGIATVIPNGTSKPKQLVTEADKMLYKAKESGRDSIMHTDLNSQC
jgi:diguanylate cyclase (GGDEF)-like protein